MNNKTYILDTNVLIDDYSAVTKYPGSLVIIPIVVLEELDNLKTKEGKLGEAARRANRELEKLRLLAIEEGSFISRGIKIENGSTVKVWGGKINQSVEGFDPNKNDNQILMCAYNFYNSQSGRDVVLVSNDINVRVKADGLGIKSKKHDSEDLTEQLYSGVAEDVRLPKRVIDTLYSTGFLKISEMYAGTGYQNVLDIMHENMYGCIKSLDGDNASALVRYSRAFDGTWIASKVDKTSAFGINGKNIEQRFALDALLNPDITLVTLIGRAGCGKTLLSLAAALEATCGGSTGHGGSHPDDYRKKGQDGKSFGKKRGNQSRPNILLEDDFDSSSYPTMKMGKPPSAKYEKIILTKPVVPMGKDIGFLPGTLEEKMAPWLQPIWDNLEFLSGKEQAKRIRDPEMGIMEISALTYIRGRSVSNSYMIIDECQNLSQHEIKTILTRMSEGSKLVLTGDIEQIDNSYLDRFNNGLSIVLEKFKDKNYAAHITLKEGQRLQMVSDAAELL